MRTIFDIETIRALCARNTLTISDKVYDKIESRRITPRHVRMAIMNGEIIEVYPDEKPDPRVLIMGYIADNNPLHVVIAIDDWSIRLVSAYNPDPGRWEADFRTRKAVQ